MLLEGTLVYKDTSYYCYIKDSFFDTKIVLTTKCLKNFSKKNLKSDDVYYFSVTKASVVNIPRNVPRDLALRVGGILKYTQEYVGWTYKRNLKRERPSYVVKTPSNLPYGYISEKNGLFSEIKLRTPFLEIEVTPSKVDSILLDINQVRKETKEYIYKMSKDILGFEWESFVSREPVESASIHASFRDVMELHKDKNLKWLNGRKYKVVTDETLDEVIEILMNHEGYLAYDTETSGLEITFKSRTGEGKQLVGVVLSKETGEGFYFPLQHKLFNNLCNGDHFYVMNKYFKKLLETKKLIVHNATFDWKVSYIYDINANIVYDTIIALGLTYKYKYGEMFGIGLKPITKRLFDRDMLDLADFVLSNNFRDTNVAFWDLPYDFVEAYAPADTDSTLELFLYLENNNVLNEYNALKVFKIETEYAKSVSYSEFWGFHISVENIPRLTREILGGREKYKNLMIEEIGRDFNPNSPVQLVPILYNELGLPDLDGYKKSTKKDVLKIYRKMKDDDGKPLYPFVSNLLKYRPYATIYSNFLSKLSTFMSYDGFIFSKVDQLGASTGRSSVSKPNYQSYNDEVKREVSPRMGYIHMDSDFSQVEYRVLASLAVQEALMEAFNDADLDYHSYQASRMFGVLYALVSAELRQQSKGVNFGLPFGMGDKSLGAVIFGKSTPVNTRKARVLRGKFFEGQEKIEAFFKRVRDKGVSEKFTSTNFGRRRYYGIPNNAKEYKERESLGLRDYKKFRDSDATIRRQAGNHVIQGSAADIYKIAINRLFNRVVKEGWLGKVLFDAFVHDEVLMEVHETINPYYYIKAWREEFELDLEGYCKLYAGIGVGRCWYNAKKEDFPPQYIDILERKCNKEDEWEYNHDLFITNIYKGFEEYRVNRVKDYLLAKENQGHVIAPVIGKMLSGLVKMIYTRLSLEQVQEYRGILKGTFKFYHKEEGVNGELFDIKDLENQIGIFFKYLGIEEKVDIKAPNYVPPKKEIKRLETSNYFSNTTLLEGIEKQGFYVDHKTNIFHMKEIEVDYKGISALLSYVLKKKGYVKEGEKSGTYVIKYYTEDFKEGILIPLHYIEVSDIMNIVKEYKEVVV